LGTITRKIDFPLLFQVAKARPEWSIVLLGPIQQGEFRHTIEFNELFKMRNVYYIPPVPFNRIPAHMVHLDAGLIPYNLYGHAGYSESPLKMYQYWAAGIPVITTPLPNIRHEPGFLSVAGTAREWIEMIDWELTSDSMEQKKKRIKRAQENSWSGRAKQIYDIITSLFVEQ
jgi:hypothetical protein